MNKNNYKRVFATSCLGVVILAWSQFASAVTLSITPLSRTIGATDTVDVGLMISGLGDFAPDSLGTFDLDITYESSVLTFQSAVFGDQLDLFGLGSIQDVIPGSNSVEVVEISLDDPADLDSLQEGSFLLATLTFMANATGTSAIGIDVIDLGDAFGDPLTADTVNGGSVTVVPLPAAVWLFGSGLLGLAGATKCKKAA